MTVHVYANLAPIGWIDLSTDPTAKMGNRMVEPYIWWEENAEIYNPFKPDRENSMYELPYVDLSFKGKDYRVSPYHLQIVTD